MTPDFAQPNHATIGGVPPGWRVHEVKIRVFNLANPGEDVECGKLLTRFTVSSDDDAERLVSMSVAPRPVYTEAGQIFLDVTWAVLLPIQNPASPVTPVTSDRRDASDAAAGARESFAATQKTAVPSPGKPAALDLD
jgi:hypothetical protein